MPLIQKKNKEKIINRLSVFAIALAFCFIFAPVATDIYIHAAPPDDAGQSYEEGMGGAEAPKPLAETMGDEILQGVLNDTTDLLTGNSTGPLAAVYTAAIEQDVTNTFSTVYMILKNVGAMWCLGIAISHIFTNLERGLDPMECTYKALTEIAIAGIFIMYLGKMMGKITEIGTLINSTIGTAANTLSTELTGEKLLELITGETKGDILWEFKAVIMLILPWVITKTMKILANFVAVQILFEVAIRKMFAPLAVADIYQEGMRSPGARYFKKFLACLLRLGLSIFICIIAGDVLQLVYSLPATDAGTFFGMIFAVISVELACITLMFKTSQFANDVTGVN